MFYKVNLGVSLWFFFFLLIFFILWNKKTVSKLTFRIPFLIHSLLILPQIFWILEAENLKNTASVIRSKTSCSSKHLSLRNAEVQWLNVNQEARFKKGSGSRVIKLRSRRSWNSYRLSISLKHYGIKCHF